MFWIKYILSLNGAFENRPISFDSEDLKQLVVFNGLRRIKEEMELNSLIEIEQVRKFMKQHSIVESFFDTDNRIDY